MKRLLTIVLAILIAAPGLLPVVAEETEPTYTYNAGWSVFPTVWDPLRQQTEQDSTVLSYLFTALYQFDYNDDLDGYRVVPLAAVSEPEDVTADYVGDAWGIAEGETARAWKVTIRPDLCWEDGTGITAYDYEETARLQLNPKAQNYRADSLYNGNLVITNAEQYAKQGVASDVSLSAYMSIVGVEDIEQLIAEHGDEPATINWSYSFGDTYDFETGEWTGAAEDEKAETGKTLSELYAFYTAGAGAEYATWASADDMKAYAYDELFVKYTYPETDWSTVGIKALSDSEFVLILTKPLQGFYLLYSLTDMAVVNQELYARCVSEDGGVYNCTYGTSAETMMSYGPYRLTEFQSDKVMKFEKNDKWFGYAEETEVPIYQTTCIRYDYVAEPATRLEMFLNGQLDVYGLQASDMETYSTSDYCYYSEGDSVFALAFNPDKAALEANQATAGENINKTILTVKEFRMAMSLSLDRSAFCAAVDPTSDAALALYGKQIVADPEIGLFYRNTDEAKQVIVDFWGLTDEVGDGRLYATADDAIDSITGYNLEMAQGLFDAAYDQAIETGLMDEDDVVEIIIGTPNNTSEFYNNGYDFLVNNYTEAVKGTKLEGKLTFKLDATLGNGFAEALRTNKVDMEFGVGWTGSTFDPYNLMEAYTANTYQYDPSWDSTTAKVTVELDGEAYTASASEWTACISGEEITAVLSDGTTKQISLGSTLDEGLTHQRYQVLAALENTVLQNYDFIPLNGDASAVLSGMQVEYYTEEEIFPMGRGGLKYMTYNYTDAEWEAYVAEQGGTLNYK